MKDKNLFDSLPEISMLIVSVILINWFSGDKATFNYLLLILIGIIFVRSAEIKELFVDDLKNIF